MASLYLGGGGTNFISIPRTLIYTSSTTFVVPQTGDYVITCIGKGGNGGAGRIENSTSVTYSSGAGGGSGSIAKSLLSLEKDITYEITIDSSTSSFSDLLSAGAGSNGGGGSGWSANNDYAKGGTGGIASGGNIININGNPGADSSRTNWNATVYPKGANMPLSTIAGQSNGNGGAGYFPIDMIIGVDPTGAAPGESGKYGGGNGGTTYVNGTNNIPISYCGYGGAAFGGGGGGGKSGYVSASTPGYAYGGSGGSGAVIIEYNEIYENM